MATKKKVSKKKTTKKKVSKKKTKKKVKIIEVIPKANGRPTKYEKRYDDMAYKLCTMGATNQDLADLFKTSLATIKLWLTKHSSFSASIKEAKNIMDDVIENSLFNRAKGYSHEDTHVSAYMGDVILTPVVKHYAPDTKACELWLRNRKSKEWRINPEDDSNDHVEPVNITFNVSPAKKDVRVTKGKKK